MAYSIQSLSLCSGVGMLDEGIRLACEYLNWPYRCVGMCERDAYAAGILLARMEESALEPTSIFCGSLEEMDAESLRGYVNFISAGFPCQPHSLAGKRKSTDDERWIWPAIVEVIRKVGPEWVFLENVPGLLSSGGGAGFGTVLRDLAESGFNVEWCCVSAAQVGASHRRERVFILAHNQSVGRESRGTESAGLIGGTGTSINGSELAHSSGTRLEKRGGQRSDNGTQCQAIKRSGSNMGHAGGKRRQTGNVSIQPSGIEPSAGTAQDTGEGCGDVGHTGYSQTGNGVTGKAQLKTRDCWRGMQEFGGGGGAFAPGPSDYDRWSEVIAHAPHLAPAIEPGFRVLADGLAYVVDLSRPDQLRCGGNGVVPLQAAVAFVELVRRFERW